MQRATDGEEPIVVPQWVPTAVEDDDAVEDARRRGADSVRVTTAKVYELIDVVGEAELDARRLERASGAIDAIVADTSHWLRALRDALAFDRPRATRSRRRWSGCSLRTTRCWPPRVICTSSPTMRRAGWPRCVTARWVWRWCRSGGSSPVCRGWSATSLLTTGKDVRLVLQGQDVELDKQVLDGVSDALKHLVVNAVDHGCEPPG